MNRQFVYAMIALAACGAAVAEPPPKTSSQETKDETNSPISASSKTSPSRAINSSENQPDRTNSQQQYVGFPSVGVKLLRPDGFEDAEKFYGFQQPSTQASIMLVLIPGPYAESTSGFTADKLNTRGMKLLSKEDVTIDGKKGLLINVTQDFYGRKFAKWILAFGDERETKLVTATFRKSDQDSSEQLKAVVLSAKVDGTPPPTPGADVAFSIEASDKLKLARGLGKMLMYTKDGTMRAKSPGDPLFIAAPSLTTVSMKSTRQFATQRLFQTAQTKIGSVTATKEITIDGLKGYEMIADGEESGSGIPLRVYQVMLFDGGSYFLMQGLVGADLADEYLPLFKAMARSLKRKAK